MPEVLTPPNDTRRLNRFSLALPIKVENSVNAESSWTEITRLQDVSAFGAGFNLKRPVTRGHLLMMTMPLPRQLRVYDFTEPQYRIWGLVRRCIKLEEQPPVENYALGVAFIGKNPPAGFRQNPARLYDVAEREGGFWEVKDIELKQEENPMPPDQRRHSRFSIPLTLLIEKIDGEGNLIVSDYAVTENLSVSGAALITAIEAEVGTFLRVISDQYNTSIIAVVRGKRMGGDNLPRLHVEFIDQLFPLEGIE